MDTLEFNSPLQLIELAYKEMDVNWVLIYFIKEYVCMCLKLYLPFIRRNECLQHLLTNFSCFPITFDFEFYSISCFFLLPSYFYLFNLSHSVLFWLTNNFLLLFLLILLILIDLVFTFTLSLCICVCHGFYLL